MRHTDLPLRRQSTDAGGIVLTIPANFYSKEAVLRACYEYLGVAFVTINCSRKYFVVEMKPKEPEGDIDAITNRFCNELIDYELRTIIAAQTQEVRSALIQKAFSA